MESDGGKGQGELIEPNNHLRGVPLHREPRMIVRLRQRCEGNTIQQPRKRHPDSVNTLILARKSYE
jgi:hypothetical protein